MDIGLLRKHVVSGYAVVATFCGSQNAHFAGRRMQQGLSIGPPPAALRVFERRLQFVSHEKCVSQVAECGSVLTPGKSAGGRPVGKTAAVREPRKMHFVRHGMRCPYRQARYLRLCGSQGSVFVSCATNGTFCTPQNAAVFSTGL